MKSFKDAAGQAWDIAVNLQTRALVSARTGIDLFLIGSGDRHTVELLQSPSHSFDVLVTLCESQMQSRGITLEQFGASLNSDQVVNAAITATVEAVFDFFQNPQAKVLRASLMMALKIMQEEQQTAATQMEAFLTSPEFEAKLRAEILGEQPKANAGDSPESSGSTQDDSRGGS